MYFFGGTYEWKEDYNACSPKCCQAEAQRLYNDAVEKRRREAVAGCGKEVGGFVAWHFGTLIGGEIWMNRQLTLKGWLRWLFRIRKPGPPDIYNTLEKRK